ncbi:MAG: type I-B CRISPR-associated endonuclease Cas1b [Bacteroidales bacterium]|nr:type I-B CRISPR-associated endonuclease Cas1b [Bacteroidales bacterium]
MKKTYYLFNSGKLSRKDNTLKFTPNDENGNEQQPRYLPIENISEFYAFGAVDTNSAIFNFLGKEQIPIHYFDYYENYTGSFMPKDDLISGKMLIAQVKMQQNKKKRIKIAQLILEGATFNMIKNLKYYNSRGKDLVPLMEIMNSLYEKISSTTAIDELMGIEGNIRKNYYEAFELIINDFSMCGRSYRPPKNEINALISFGNMMCYSQCLRAIHQTQLNPTISFLHQPGERRYSLSLDLAEIFKPLLVDRVIFKVLNKKMIQTSDFEEKLNCVLLKENGKKIFVQAFEDRLQETIQHRSLGRSVSYKHLIKLECYKLQKHILEIEEYKPFKMWW